MSKNVSVVSPYCTTALSTVRTKSCVAGSATRATVRSLARPVAAK